MIKSITVTNYLGDSLKLELAKPEKSGFIVETMGGLGAGKATINTTEVATNDGSLYNSARVSSRNITLGLRFLENPSVEDIRQKSYKYFPLKKPVTLRIETDNRLSEIEGYVESNDPDIFSKEEGTDISIICPFPFFHSALGNQVTVFSGIEPMFEFPFSNESLKEKLLLMGEIRKKAENVIVYEGDVETGITITIHAMGEASNITIYNVSTRESMSIDTVKLASMTGSGIVAGDDIIICTVRGQKSVTLVREGDEFNILNCLNKNADWFQLSKGNNIFAYTATEGDSNLQFKVENRILYEGV